MIIDNFSVETFRSDIWQKSPAVIKGMFPEFQDPLNADELAGLALEPGVDSRVIQCNRGTWNLSHGPFEQYDQLGDSHWTLLVQAVNEHYPPAREIINAFQWMPSWRLDDLMVSFSTPQGGVGPHIDQYDVFIIQGDGKRRWQVGAKGNYQERTPHPDLKQIEAFEPIIDEVLECGDVIYIPAGFPHEGTAITPSLNYSVGFRAPSQAELLSSLADFALEFDKLGSRYTDSQESLFAQSNRSDFLPEEAIERIQNMLQDAVQDKTLIAQVAAKVLSTNPRPPLQFWPEINIAPPELIRMLAQSDGWLTAPGLRWLFTSGQVSEPRAVYIQGTKFKSTPAVESLFKHINVQETLNTQWLIALCESSREVSTVVSWMYNEGLVVSKNELEAED